MEFEILNISKNSHKMGNFPTLLIMKLITTNPNAYVVSKIIPCSRVSSSSLVAQI